MSHLQTWAGQHRLEAMIAAVGVVIVVVAAYRWLAPKIRRWAKAASAGAPVVTLAAMVGTCVSLNTNWLFFGEKLNVTHLYDRIPIFAFGEIALIGTALMARTKKLATTTEDKRGSTGWYGKLVWIISAASCIPALELAGLGGGLVRALFGPLGAAVMWHMALDIEITVSRPDAAESRTARALRQLRERMFARLGLLDLDEDAAAIARRLAVTRAAELIVDHQALDSAWFFKSKRRARMGRQLQRALLVAEVDSDPAQEELLFRKIAYAQNARRLFTLELPAPWERRLMTRGPEPSTPGAANLAPRTAEPADPRTFPPETGEPSIAFGPNTAARPEPARTSEPGRQDPGPADSDLRPSDSVGGSGQRRYVPAQRVSGANLADEAYETGSPYAAAVLPSWAGHAQPMPGAEARLGDVGPSGAEARLGADPAGFAAPNPRTLAATETGDFGTFEAQHAVPDPARQLERPAGQIPTTVLDESEEDLARLPWSSETSRIARNVVAAWRAGRHPIKRAELLAEVRERGGSVSNRDRTAFYNWAIAPAQPGDESAAEADSDLLETADAR